MRAFFSVFALAACGDDASGSDGAGGTRDASSSSSSTSGGGGAGGAVVDPGAALLGTWKSQDCEVTSAMSSLRRTYVFAPTEVAITFDQFAGTTCEDGPKVMSISIHGNSKILGPSQAVDGALEIVFTIESKAITPTAAGVDFLTGACGEYTWTADVEQDITQNGCGTLVSTAAACPAEYDLAAVIDDVLAAVSRRSLSSPQHKTLHKSAGRCAKSQSLSAPCPTPPLDWHRSSPNPSLSSPSRHSARRELFLAARRAPRHRDGSACLTGEQAACDATGGPSAREPASLPYNLSPHTTIARDCRR